MIPHPKTMQAVTDQHWHQLRVETQRERLAMTSREQQAEATHHATLRLHVVSALRMLQPIFGPRLDIGMPRDAQRPVIP